MIRRAIPLLLGLACAREATPFDPVAASRDRVVVLAFVTTECPISNRYAPTLRALREEFGERGVDFWAVYPDPDDDASAIEEHRRAYGMGYTPVRDPQHELVRLVGARVTPEVAVYSAGAQVYRGRIDDRAVAYGNFRAEAREEDLANAIASTLRGAAVEPSVTDAIGCVIADLK